MGFNKLLEKQLKKFLAGTDCMKDEQFLRFLHAVNDSYESYERDRSLSNHAFSMSELEYQDVNARLRDEVALKRQSLSKLLELTKSLGDTVGPGDEAGDDLSALIRYLETQLRQKQEAEEILSQSEKRMRLGLQTIEDNIWEYDFEQRKMVFAQTDNSFMKLSRKEYVGDENNEWWETIYPEDLEIAADIFRKYVKGEISKHHIEYRTYCADGSIKWILNRGGVIKRDEKGQVLKVVGAITDIDHFKTAQTELKVTANRLSHLLAGMDDGVMVVDETRKIILVNQRFCDLFFPMHPPHIIAGMDAAQLLQRLAGLFKQPDAFINRVNTLLWEKMPVNGEELQTMNDMFIERAFIPVFIGTEYKGHLWKYTDITSRKFSENKLKREEEKYRNIIANMNLGLLEMDMDERILYANQSFCDMSGYPMEELIGRNATALFVGAGNTAAKEKQELRAQGISDAYELPVKDKRGQLKWWLVSGAPRYNDENELIGSIGIHLDITAHKELEIALTNAKQAAEESSRMKEAFLANMSHEIRTPLSAIWGMSRLLADTGLNDAQTFYIRTIDKSAEHLLMIINDILDISKIQAGMMQLENIGFHLRDLIDEAMEVVKHRADEKGLTLSKDIDADIAPVIIGDPFRLKQVLLNLLSNALKFTMSGSVNIACHLLSEDEQSITLVIRVTDTGPGMEEAFVRDIFKNFSQADKSTARKHGGTGLGMSICKQLTALMGGGILVESHVNVGTTVIMNIPFKKGTEKDIPQREELVADTRILKGSRVLLVEDNEINQLIASMILEKHGTKVVRAENGEEAIMAMKKEDFDLVLMDMQMPVMGGLEATAYIRANIDDRTPIIALTANAIKGESDRCFQVGMNDYITKPFEEELLVNTIAGWLGKRQGTAARVEGSQAEKPAEKLYNLKRLEKICNGSPDFMQKMVKLFLEQIPLNVSQMKNAYETGDLSTVAALAHRIKPTLETMNINSLHDDIRKVESLAKEAPGSPELPAAIARVVEITLEVADQLKRDFQ
jgi:PAS domain S-box-containing protein